MRLWVHRQIEAPPTEGWALLTDPARWGAWGPSVRGATLDGPFATGTAGRVHTTFGPSLPFVLTDVVPERRWSWKVAGVPATSHSVEQVGTGCRVGFGVPVVAAPYLVVCRVALARIDAMLTG